MLFQRFGYVSTRANAANRLSSLQISEFPDSHLCDDISIPSQEKLLVYSRKIVTISNILTVMFTRNWLQELRQ